MNKQISLLLMIIFSTLTFYAQTEKNVAPVKWERYKVSKRNVSVELPKMPVLIESSDYCNEAEATTYVAYAEEAVYQIRIASKSKEKIPEFCSEKNKFGRNAFEAGIKRLKAEQENPIETRLTINEREVVKIDGKYTTNWVFNDLTDNKWIELSITHRDDTTPKSKRFIDSLNFAENPNGIEIGDGSSQTLGDTSEIENKNSEDAKPAAGIEKGSSMILVAKPRASYTDAARQAQIQGTVLLKVTFLASGGIGIITPVSGLSHGLTEQAIAAAKKIVFIPTKGNGKTYSVVKMVQYNFNIY